MDFAKWSVGDYLKIVLDHVGVAVNALDSASTFWKLLGLNQGEDEVHAEQGVNIRFFSTDETDDAVRIELLEPLSEDSPVGKFIAKRGTGIQQLAFRVDQLDDLVAELHDNGIQLINPEPVAGAGGSRVVFVHPKSTGGVLVELLER